jgi:hypothetical protein
MHSPAEDAETRKKQGTNRMKKQIKIIQGISLTCLTGLLIFSILAAGCTDTVRQPETTLSTIPTTLPVKNVTTAPTTVTATMETTTVASRIPVTPPQGSDQNPQYTRNTRGSGNQGSGNRSFPSARGTLSMDMLTQMASDLKSKGYDVSGLEKAIDANDQSAIQSWFENFMKTHPEAMQR